MIASAYSKVFGMQVVSLRLHGCFRHKLSFMN